MSPGSILSLKRQGLFFDEFGNLLAETHPP
jgi:hypothetical protein